MEFEVLLVKRMRIGVPGRFPGAQTDCCARAVRWLRLEARHQNGHLSLAA